MYESYLSNMAAQPSIWRSFLTCTQITVQGGRYVAQREVIILTGCEKCTNLPERIAEKLSSRLPPLSICQVVVEHAWITFHCICLMKHSIHIIVSVDVILDETIQGNLQFGSKR